MMSISNNLFKSVLVFFCILGMFLGVYTARVMLQTEITLTAQAQEVIELAQVASRTDGRADPRDELLESGKELGYSSTKGSVRDIRDIIAGIIKTVLTFVGIILTVLIVYAGYLWLTARGNDDQVTKAKATLRNSVIGIIIIVMSFALTTFLFNSFEPTTTGESEKAIQNFNENPGLGDLPPPDPYSI